MPIPDTAPFTEEQKAILDRLLPGITSAQLQWLAGYLAGLESAQSSTRCPAPQVAPGAIAAASAPPLTILFGSESGNAQTLAQEAQRSAAQRGFRAVVKDMEKLSAADLAQERHVLVITSTWGDGEPPVNAADLYQSLMSEEAPRFEGMRFSVCALGDTGYQKFCQTGKDFDLRLEALGAARLHPLAECDVDFEPTFRPWLEGVLQSLQESTAFLPGASSSATVLTEAASAPLRALSYGKSHPFPAPLREKILLSGRGSTKEVWHLEFSLASSGLRYEPGDALAVLPTNSPDTVDALLNAGNFRDATIRDEDGTAVPFFDVLQRSHDITTLSKTLLTKYNQLARSPKLERWLQEDGAELQAFLHGRQIVDLLEEFPVPGLSAEDFLGILRKLPPRLYSIASSQRAYPDDVHLTVAAVRFESHGRPRKGVASTCLADIIDIGGIAPAYIAPNKHFKLPGDPSVPVIMIGPGTGVAPFRAFVQERHASGTTGKNWLFFGDQHSTTDFLYQVEWQEALKHGSLTRLDVAFSRDQKEKIYVQHRMEERAGELWNWLQEGAHIYVCGNASHMAPDVHETLIRTVEVQGHHSREEAESYMERLRKSGRYQRDVY